jgi:hypothetical protein
MRRLDPATAAAAGSAQPLDPWSLFDMWPETQLSMVLGAQPVTGPEFLLRG